VENLKPRYRSRKRSGFRRKTAFADEMAVARARVRSAFYSMRCAAEAQLLQHYAIKFAGLFLTLSLAQASAAVAALSLERDAALRALQTHMKIMERHHLTTVVGYMRQTKKRNFRTQVTIAGGPTLLLGQYYRSSPLRPRHVPRGIRNRIVGRSPRPPTL